MNKEGTDKKRYVYILVNSAFTGFVKIGKTVNEPEVRARQLSSGSGVPAPYAVAWDAFNSDCDHVEKLIHQQLVHTRSRNNRDLFAIPLRNQYP
jgi:T5orf172 domain